jgi:hypothetical protein
MIAWDWVRRYPPLEPSAVAGREAVRDQLAGRVAGDPDPQRLRATGSSDWLLLLGKTEDLPWVEGARYLGWDHGILVPTTHCPAVPMDLLARVLRRRYRAELIVLLPGEILTSTMPVHPVDVNLLAVRP